LKRIKLVAAIWKLFDISDVLVDESLEFRKSLFELGVELFKAKLIAHENALDGESMPFFEFFFQRVFTYDIFRGRLLSLYFPY
jgi:hypothetical protein